MTYPLLRYRGNYGLTIGLDYSGARLRSEFGGGYSETDNIFPPLLTAQLNYSALSTRSQVPETGKDRLSYFWDFYRDAMENHEGRFLMYAPLPLEERLYLWEFADPALGLSAVNMYLATTGVAVRQCYDRQLSFLSDGSLDLDYLTYRTMLLRDEFTADGANAGRRPDPINFVGSRWLAGSGAWTITDGVLTPPSPFADGDFQTVDAGTGDVTLTARVSSDAGTNSATSTSAGLVFRYEDSNNFWLLATDARAGTTVLYEKTAGVFTARATLAGAGASNGVISLTVTAVGPDITIFLVGLDPVVYTSTAHQAATRVGVRAGNGGGTPAGVPTFAEFTVMPAPARQAAAVIERGASGQWDDEDVAAPSSPVWDAANNRYCIAYSGFNGTIWQTGFAYSTDLLTWTKEPTNPKLTPVTREGYIAASAGLVYANGTWYLVYQGAEDATAGSPLGDWEVFAASSPNMTSGGTWTRLNSGNPILPLGTGGAFDRSHHDPDVRFRTDGQFEVLFAARDGGGLFTIGRAVGASLTALGATEQLPVVPGLTGILNPTAAGTDPDSFSIYFCYGVAGVRQILRADTDDGGATFKFLNLALGNSSAGWDGVQVFDPALLLTDQGLYLFYAGSNASGDTEGMGADIGLAVIDA